MESVSEPSYEECNVRTLSPPVRMKLIEDQKFQSICMLNYTYIDILITGEDEFHHHVVGQEDVRRILN